MSQSITQETLVGSDHKGLLPLLPYLLGSTPPPHPSAPTLIFPARYTRGPLATLHDWHFTSSCGQGLGQREPVSGLFLRVPITVTHPPAEGPLLHPALTHTCAQRRRSWWPPSPPGLCHPSSMQQDPPACRCPGFRDPGQRAPKLGCVPVGDTAGTVTPSPQCAQVAAAMSPALALVSEQLALTEHVPESPCSSLHSTSQPPCISQQF